MNEESLDSIEVFLLLLTTYSKNLFRACYLLRIVVRESTVLPACTDGHLLTR